MPGPGYDDAATAIAQAVVDDISDRAGLGDEWDQINETIQREVRAELTEKIRAILQERFPDELQKAREAILHAYVDIVANPRPDPEAFRESLAPATGDPIFVLSLMCHALDGLTVDGRLQSSIGGPTYADIEFTDYRYRVTIERIRDR